MQYNERYTFNTSSTIQGGMNLLYIIGVIILFFLAYYLIQKKFIFVQTVSGAIVMALGVFSLNVGPHFGQSTAWYKILAIFTATIWAFCMVSYIISVFTGNFKKLHYENLIGRFRIGTWVASTSVTVIIISNYFPMFHRMILPLVIMNTLLWLGFFVISIKSIIHIWQGKIDVNVNGILLLTTVSTQSLVLMYNNVWHDFSSYMYINTTLIGLGFIFYTLSSILIVKRYMLSAWSLVNDWKAPNCIIHGALSIIGSGAVISQTFSYNQLLLLWIIVLLTFVIHEIVEIIRGTRRIKTYGWKEGVAVYHPSQWSRIFTFCMFYTFTLKFNANFDIQTSWIALSQQLILDYGKWVIASLLLIEIGLFFRSLFPNKVQDIDLQQTAN